MATARCASSNAATAIEPVQERNAVDIVVLHFGERIGRPRPVSIRSCAEPSNSVSDCNVGRGVHGRARAIASG
jgi:hypothetical protein